MTLTALHSERSIVSHAQCHQSQWSPLPSTVPGPTTPPMRASLSACDGSHLSAPVQCLVERALRSAADASGGGPAQRPPCHRRCDSPQRRRQVCAWCACAAWLMRPSASPRRPRGDPGPAVVLAWRADHRRRQRIRSYELLCAVLCVVCAAVRAAAASEGTRPCAVKPSETQRSLQTTKNTAIKKTEHGGTRHNNHNNTQQHTTDTTHGQGGTHKGKNTADTTHTHATDTQRRDEDSEEDCAVTLLSAHRAPCALPPAQIPCATPRCDSTRFFCAHHRCCYSLDARPPCPCLWLVTWDAAQWPRQPHPHRTRMRQSSHRLGSG